MERTIVDDTLSQIWSNSRKKHQCINVHRVQIDPHGLIGHRELASVSRPATQRAIVPTSINRRIQAGRSFLASYRRLDALACFCLALFNPEPEWTILLSTISGQIKTTTERFGYAFRKAKSIGPAPDLMFGRPSPALEW